MVNSKRTRFILIIFLAVFGFGFWISQAIGPEVRDYFDTRNPGGNPQYYIATTTKLTVTGGQILLATTCTSNSQNCSSDNACCSGFCGTDTDNDGYFASSTGHTGQCSTTTKPYTDCYDSGNRSSSAYPGQINYFTVARGDGSYDYNCINGNEKYCSTITTFTSTTSCVTVKPTLIGGWVGSPPNCGVSGTRRYANGYTLAGCSGTIFPYVCGVASAGFASYMVVQDTYPQPCH